MCKVLILLVKKKKNLNKSFSTVSPEQNLDNIGLELGFQCIKSLFTIG